MKKIIELLKDLEDPDPCELDHHGNCQAHGWADMKEFSPWRECPQKRLKEILYKEKNRPEKLASLLAFLEDERIKNQNERRKTMTTLIQRAGEPIKELQISHQIKILDKQICELEEVAESLIARIRPIVTQEVCKESPPTTNPERAMLNCEIAETLCGYSDRIENIRTALSHQFEIIEI